MTTSYHRDSLNFVMLQSKQKKVIANIRFAIKYCFNYVNNTPYKFVG